MLSMMALLLAVSLQVSPVQAKDQGLEGQYEICATTLGDGTEIGTEELPCGDALSTKKGIRIRFESGLSETVGACVKGNNKTSKYCFTREWTGSTMVYEVRQR